MMLFRDPVDVEFPRICYETYVDKVQYRIRRSAAGSRFALQHRSLGSAVWHDDGRYDSLQHLLESNERLCLWAAAAEIMLWKTR